MIIHMPDNMIDQLQANQDTRINYYINQSVPTLTKQMMETEVVEVVSQTVELVQEKVGYQDGYSWKMWLHYEDGIVENCRFCIKTTWM